MPNYDEIRKMSIANPVWFITRILRVPFVTPQQIKICESVRDNRRTACPSGHGIGKTHIAACIVAWFLFSFPNSKIVTTAPTWFQVENLLWTEIRSILSRSAFAKDIHPNLTSMKLANDWFAIGLSTDDSTKFQGIHAPYVLIVFDEATGVDAAIWEAAEGVAIGKDDRFLAIGNPTDPTSEFKRVCDSNLWNVINLSSEQHPNVLENRQIVPGAVTKEWIDERLIDYGGRETPLYRARVRGLFPEQGDDMLISLADVERAQARWVKPEKTQTPDAVGCDVARFGSDETIDVEIYGQTVFISNATRGKDTMETAGRLKASKAVKKAVDDAGVGGGVTDRLNEQNVNVMAYNAGASANNPEQFLNLRAESWWNIRELLRTDKLDLPPNNKLIADLTNVKYSYTSKGQIKLESKDEIKKRIKRSPDRGDALAIALTALTHRKTGNLIKF